MEFKELKKGDVHNIELEIAKEWENEDILKKYKRGYFIEWRIADKHKAERFNCFDYVVDTNVANDPKMISRYTFTESLKQLAQKPFRTVPYFDPGVWGGQWMKEVCDLDREGFTTYKFRSICYICIKHIIKVLVVSNFVSICHTPFYEETSFVLG